MSGDLSCAVSLVAVGSEFLLASLLSAVSSESSEELDLADILSEGLDLPDVFPGEGLSDLSFL